MQVMAYPANLTGELKGLPLVQADGGAFLLPVEFGDWVTLEIVNAFKVAAAKGCQWLVVKNRPVVRDETEWHAI